MSKRFPQFPFFAEDFLSGCRTSGMSAEEIGVYIQFLCHNWLSGGPVPADPDLLKNALGFGRKTINALIPRLVEMGKISFGEGVLWNERTQADVIKYQGKEARPAPQSDPDSKTAVRAIFAPKIADKSAKDRAKIGQTSAKDRPDIGDVQPIFLETSNENKAATGHTRASTSTSTSKSPTTTVELEPAREGAAGVGFERANLLDTGDPGAHVNCTTIIARYSDGREIKIPKTVVHDTGRRMGLSQARSELIAQRVLDGWIVDDWRPDRPNDALKRGMAKRAGEAEEIAVVAPKFEDLIPASPGIYNPPEEGGIEYD